MADWSRPASSERFRFEGLKTNSSPDSMGVGKHPYAQNVRGVNEHSTQSRNQFVQQVVAPSANSITALEPALGITKQGGNLTSFTSGIIDTGYESGQGCSIVPFRPNASPNAYDYVFDNNKQTKTNGTVVQKIGIAEPQTSPQACVDQYNVFEFTGAAGNWTAAGTAGALTDQNRDTDTAVAFFADPASVAPSLSTRYSMQVGSSQYQTGMAITVANALGGTVPMIVQDVLPAINTQSTVTIQAIFYISGSTGRCVIVLTQMPIDNTIPSFDGANPVIGSNSPALISALRRGSLIELNPGGGNQEIVFVLSVTSGPQGSVAIEVVTANTHVATEALIGIPALAVSFTQNPANLTGQAILATAIKSTVTTGTGQISKPIAAANNPFTHQPFLADPTLSTAQQEDYVHISLNVDVPTNVTEIRLYFDVNNGSADFVSNCFYFAIRQSDIASAAASTQTQLAASQLALQRAQIDQQAQFRAAGSSFNPELSRVLPNVEINPTIDIGSSSGQTATGTSQWTEIMFPVLSMTRIGNDETRTLANTQAVMVQVVCTGNVVIEFSSIWVGAGGQPDIGDVGQLYFYRVVPRSSVTGAKGNPSPSTRYGVAPRRQKVIISLPSPAYDSQIDSWDIFRIGGTVTDWRYIGTTQSSATTFSDNIFDSSIVQNPSLDFLDLEPWPSIGPPITASSATVVGTAMTATFPTASASPSLAGTLSQLGSMLPGNLFNIGNLEFTLFNRPTLVSSTPTTQTYLFRFVENAGSLTNPLVLCQEPALAAQTASSVVGPDANGILFSCLVGAAVTTRSSGLRPGLIQWCNNNNPDSASDGNTSEISNPLEPLINGALVGSTPCVASSKRWWRGFYSQDSLGNPRYSWREIPVGAGLACQFGICGDGQYVYFVATDGIRRHSLGASQSLTNDDLYNLFPHEGVFPQNVTYLGKTVFAPEYAFAESFRLNVVNGYLYFDYLDSNQNPRTLTCDLRRIAWCVDRVDDANFPQMTIHAGTGKPASNFGLPGIAAKNQQLFLGGANGAVYIEQTTMTPNSGESVSCVLATREDMFGDVRARKLFGDIALDCLAAGGNITANPVLFGSLFGTPTTITGGQTSRPDIPFNVTLSGEQKDRSLGLLLSWTDQGVNSVFYLWQPSYLGQPEDASTRFSDWDNGGTEGNKFIQGFEVECDSANVPKIVKIRDADALAFHDFTSPAGTNLIQANGQQVIVCSFVTPFIAHLCRYEPQDSVNWSVWRWKYIWQPTPESALTWTTQASNFGLDGYIHAKEILACYSSTQPVTLTVTCFDGLSPSVITLPSTGGTVQKILFPFSPNKGLLFTFSGVSIAPWAPYWDAWEIKCRAWGDSGPYKTYRNLGGQFGDQARV